MALVLFNNLSEKDKSNAIENLITESTPRQDFFLMVILSVLMATFGILINNTAVIIGSMLIAPILYPILSLSLGIVMADFKLISRSFYTLLKSMVFGIAAAALIALFFAQGYETSLVEPSLIYVMIAIIAGLAASFALIKPQLSETLPGIAISVTLIPPLAATGIGIAKFDWNLISNSFVLFMVNAIGIIFASMIVFSLMHLYIKRVEARKAIKKEEKAVKQEKENAEKEKEKNSSL
ncbi:TIGR00341 family protein [bacterium]|nr:TIGR00341 family protein [bacterium]